MKRIFLVLAFLYCIVNHGQNYVDIAHLFYATTNTNQFENSDQNTAIESFHFELNIPIPITKKNALLTGIYFDKTQLQLDPFSIKHQLYLIGLELGIYHQFNDTWSATFMFRPRIASDLIKFTNNDIQFGLLSLINLKRNNNLSYKFGLYTINENYGQLYVPLVGLYHLSPSGWEYNIMAPIKMNVLKYLNQKLAIGLLFDGIGNTFNLSTGYADTEQAYVTKSSNEFLGIIEYKIGTSFLLTAQVGYSFFRSYKVFDSNDKVNFSIATIYFGDDRKELNSTFKDGLIFKTALTYRFDLN